MMNVTDILDKAQFVVDAGGEKKSVLRPGRLYYPYWKTWKT